MGCRYLFLGLHVTAAWHREHRGHRPDAPKVPRGHRPDAP